MATIAQNDVEAVGVAMREAMLEQMLPTSALGRPRWSRSGNWSEWAGSVICPTSAITPRPRHDRSAARGDRTPIRRRCCYRRPSICGLVLADREPGRSAPAPPTRRRLVECIERRAHAKYIDASRLFLQGNPRLAPMDGRHRGLPPFDDGRTRALWRPARGILAVPDRVLRRRTERILLLVRTELPGDLLLPARPAGNTSGDAAHPDQDERLGGAALGVRLHGLQLDRSSSDERPHPVPGAGREGARRPRDARDRLRRQPEDHEHEHRHLDQARRCSCATPGVRPGDHGYGALPTTTSPTSSPSTSGRC